MKSIVYITFHHGMTTMQSIVYITFHRGHFSLVTTMKSNIHYTFKRFFGSYLLFLECYSHIAGKKYWIISLVVEVITCQSNEFITLTRDYLNHSWYYPILFNSYMGISHYYNHDPELSVLLLILKLALPLTQTDNFSLLL